MRSATILADHGETQAPQESAQINILTQVLHITTLEIIISEVPRTTQQPDNSTTDFLGSKIPRHYFLLPTQQNP
jgi:hypothetical protein